MQVCSLVWPDPRLGIQSKYIQLINCDHKMQLFTKILCLLGHPEGKQPGYQAPLGEENPPTDPRHVLWDLQGQRLPALYLCAAAE